jgi:hypothetical protein
MSFHDAKPLRFAAACAEARADALVVAAMRGAMAGARGGAAYLGEHALAGAMSPAEARAILGRFHHFARALIVAAERPLEWRSLASPHLARDEAQMLRMIAAAQCSDFCRLHEIAGRLLLGANLAPALQATQALAAALAARGLFVSDP